MRGIIKSVEVRHFYRNQHGELRTLTYDVEVVGNTWELKMERLQSADIPSLGREVEVVIEDGKPVLK